MKEDKVDFKEHLKREEEEQENWACPAFAASLVQLVVSEPRHDPT